MSLNKRIWKICDVFFEVFKRLRIDIILIAIIPRGSFHVPKPKANSVRLIAFVVAIFDQSLLLRIYLALVMGNSLIYHKRRVIFQSWMKCRTSWNWQARFHLVAWWRHPWDIGVRMKWILNTFKPKALRSFDREHSGIASLCPTLFKNVSLVQLVSNMVTTNKKEENINLVAIMCSVKKFKFELN